MEMTNWSGKPFPRESVLAHVGPGWHPLVNKLIDDLFVLGWDGQLHQIKEKFGGLRFYIANGNKAIRDRIYAAESESDRTCDECGAAGVKRYGGWIVTRCDEHAPKDSVKGEDHE